jgi:4'-phosphopantetheinyl transferase
VLSTDVLSADERARASRFVFERDRIRYVAARSFLRHIVAACIGGDPVGLSFSYGPHGRPRLSASHGLVPDFNLSHTGDLAMLAVSWAAPVGVDVEAVRPTPDMPGLASQVMHPAELLAFGRLPPSEQTEAFFTLWTRKEALLKAMGVGLSTDPRSIHVGWSASDLHREFLVDGRVCEIRNLAGPPGFAAALCAPKGVALARCALPDALRGRPVPSCHSAEHH